MLATATSFGIEQIEVAVSAVVVYLVHVARVRLQRRNHAQVVEQNDKIIQTGNENHALLNGAHLAALQTIANYARVEFSRTKSPEDRAKSVAADKVVQDHIDAMRKPE